VRHRTGRSLDSIATVRVNIAEGAGTSLRHHSQHLGIPRSTMQRIVTEDLHAYKIQRTQELKPTDHVQRREFVNWVLENQKVDGSFSKKIIFGNEAPLSARWIREHTKLSVLGRGESSSDS